MSLLSRISQAERTLATSVRRARDAWRIARYLKSDRAPWSPGYAEFKNSFIGETLQDSALCETFRTGGALPEGFGARLDERAVELPWVMSRLAGHRGRLLDAGSALNHEFLLRDRALASLKTTIVTLAPENIAYWPLGISYVYGDLRELGFRDGWFDVVTCISTIEHVGMDNSLYATERDGAARSAPTDFLAAVREMSRVLVPGGSLYITFPYGKHELHGWLQQFDAALTDDLVAGFGAAEVHETIFRYTASGWRVSDRADAAASEYFDVHANGMVPGAPGSHAPDYAAAARAVACLHLVKPR